MKVTDFDPEDSVRPGPPQRLFCTSRRALQNTLWVQLAITYPWEVIREIKIYIKSKKSTFPSNIKTEVWRWRQCLIWSTPATFLWSSSISTKYPLGPPLYHIPVKSYSQNKNLLNFKNLHIFNFNIEIWRWSQRLGRSSPEGKLFAGCRLTKKPLGATQ